MKQIVARYPCDGTAKEKSVLSVSSVDKRSVIIRVLRGQKNKHPGGHTQEKRCVLLRILRPLRETKFASRERSIRVIVKSVVKKSTDCTDETDSRALPLRWYCERKIRVIRVICGQKNKHPGGHTQEKRCVLLRILRPLRETKFAFRERSIRVIRAICGQKNKHPGGAQAQQVHLCAFCVLCVRQNSHSAREKSVPSVGEKRAPRAWTKWLKICHKSQNYLVKAIII